MAEIGIIGWGIVGQAVGKGFDTKEENNTYWYDRYKKSPFTLSQVIERSEFIFVCVPTPMFSDESGIDLSIINEVVKKASQYMEGTEKILIIKSTVIPGTTESLIKRYRNANIAVNPEFLTEVNAPHDFLYPDRVVVGALNENHANRIALLYRSLHGYDTKIFITDPTTAEMSKYMANTFMSTKISFANEMKELSDKLKINYDDVKEIVSADPRITKSFLGVTPFAGFGGKCFPKDTVALLSFAKKMGVDLSVLNAAWKKNLKIRKVRDWEKISGAVQEKKQ